MSPLSHTPSRLRSALRNLFARTRIDRELDADVRAYVDLLTDEKVGAGLDRSAARRAALVELGGIERVKDEVREVRTGALLETTARAIVARAPQRCRADDERGPDDDRNDCRRAREHAACQVPTH